MINAKNNQEEYRYLFSWYEIPGRDSGKLIEFLTWKFGIDWVKTAKIKKIDMGKTIQVSKRKNYLSSYYLSLKLNDKNEVDLEIDDGRTDKFVAKMENDNLNIYEDKYVVMSGSGTWIASLIEGKWEGSIYWREDGKWNGHGKWGGKVISGTWIGNGSWVSEGNGIGKWEGGGKLKSNSPHPKEMAVKSLLAIGLIFNIVSVARGLVVGVIEWITTIISIVAIIVFLFADEGKKTLEGEWWVVNGEWRDEGGFRILYLRKGKGKLSNHRIDTLQGEMKEEKRLGLSDQSGIDSLI